MADEPTDGNAARIAGMLLDLVALAGAGMVTGGATMISEPAGIITGGAFLLAAAWMGARKVAD